KERDGVIGCRRRTGSSLEKSRDENPEDLMRPWFAQPIGASGHATTASTGRTHDRKATALCHTLTFPLRAGGHPHMRLLVDREHDRMLGRVDVQADDVLELGGELGATALIPNRAVHDPEEVGVNPSLSMAGLVLALFGRVSMRGNDASCKGGGPISATRDRPLCRRSDPRAPDHAGSDSAPDG
ncbi:MAG: hypothetical protein K0S98_2564, partial [Propionibacteriaceae bacterium]|nr:hypothetical protein [Propionibacteriaceae bacterium]